MIVNQAKTEIIHISRSKMEPVTVHIGNDAVKTQKSMKVLGIQMDSRLNWSEHISATVNKMNKFTGALKFIRKRLNEKQFLQVLTSQYYGTCYYGSPVWLGSHTRVMDIRKLNGLHYRLLRSTIENWQKRKNTSKSELDNLGRARPSTWSQYTVSSTAIKILRDDKPTRLSEHLLESIYCEERSGRVKFFDNSKLKQGRQALGNRLQVFEKIETPITFKESNDVIRTMLKKEFNMNKMGDGKDVVVSITNV
jgi:hypothetical protein